MSSVVTRPRQAKPAWPLTSVLPEMGVADTAPRMVRGHVRVTIAQWGMRDLIEAAEMIASELVTNVVRRASDADGNLIYNDDGKLPVFRFGLYSDRAHVLIRVWDQFADPPVPKAASDDDEAGRGLVIVDTLAEKWGAAPLAAPLRGKVVWALLRAQAAS